MYLLFKELSNHISIKLKEGPVIIASYSDGARERLSGLIKDEGLVDFVSISNASSIGKHGLYLTVWALEHGFESSGLTIISRTRCFRRSANPATKTQTSCR